MLSNPSIQEMLSFLDRVVGDPFRSIIL